MNFSDQPLRELLERAEGYAARRQWAMAIEAYETALRLRPDDASIQVQLSYVHSLAGHYGRARDYALRTVATGSRLPKVLIELIPRLRTFNEVPAMLECIESLMPPASMPIPLLVTLAAQLSYANLPERALALLDEAKSGDPRYPATLLARAQVLMYLGRFDEASVDVEAALARAPEIAQGYWLRAQLKKKGPDPARIDAIRRQMARPGQTHAGLALLGFALHKELDDAGDHDGAWRALMSGCGSKRATLEYDGAASQLLFQELGSRPHAHAHARIEPDVIDNPMPIFIVGMHRSGTTLLEQLLGGSPSVRALGELYDFTSAMRWATDHHCKGVIDREIVRRAQHADLRAVGKRYLEGVGWRLQGAASFVDKLPSNFLNIGFIAEALPQAKILHMVRDPVETCFSNLRELFSEANPYSYDPIELADFHNGYRALMRRWHARFPGRILDVDYARLTREPEAALREVCAFCAIAFDPPMLETHARQRGVVTASAVAVRSRIEARAQPKWKPYAAYLQPMIERLATAP